MGRLPQARKWAQPVDLGVTHRLCRLLPLPQAGIALDEGTNRNVAEPREGHLDHDLIDRLLVGHVDDAESTATDEVTNDLDAVAMTFVKAIAPSVTSSSCSCGISNFGVPITNTRTAHLPRRVSKPEHSNRQLRRSRA